MAKTRRAYTGGAASTTTTSAIAASGTTSFTITAYTGWPYGSDPFHIVVEPGTANEEKILVTRTGSTDTTINVYATPSVAANRGADGTAAVAHSSGSTVFPVFTALDADEANELASTMTTKGDILTHDALSFERLAVGTDDYVLLADSGEATGLKWGQVDTATLADGAVETAKLNDLAVTGGKLANATVDTKTASYTLVAGDRNKRIVMNNAGATTITVNDSVFSAGDVVWLHNIGAGTCTVTAGTATVSTVGDLALEQYAGGHLYFTSASAAIFFPTEQGGGGKILQVVSTTKSDTFSSSLTAGASTAITGLSASITPSSTASKILVNVNVTGALVGYAVTGFIVKRDGTAIGVGDTAGSRASVSSVAFAFVADTRSIMAASSQHLDSPASTSALSYTVEAVNITNVTRTAYINRTETDTDASTFPRAVSTITLMEVSA